MTIAGQVMRIQAWTPNFKQEEEFPLVPILIILPELPWHCYNKEVITSLLSPIGRVLYLDFASINKTRGSQARVKVQVDLTKDRPPHIWMGHIGENITDGRWQKIEYDSIPDYCFYCKHQGHKESNCIFKQRDEDNKKRKELEKNRPRKDTAQNTNADLQIAKEMDTGRIETVYNQQRHHNVDNQHGVIQDEWQTQKRRNGNQQTRGDTDRNSQRNEDRQGHQQQIQPGMVSVITKNTYIDLDVQDIGQSDEEGEEHIVQTHDQRQQENLNKNRIHHKNKRQTEIEGSNIHKEDNLVQQRRADQVDRIVQSENQHANVSIKGTDLNLPTRTPLNAVVFACVAVGGEAGFCQWTNRLLVDRLNKGKEKVDEQGFLIRDDREPPDKTNFDKSKKQTEV